MKDNFVWGVATAAYQIEGGAEADGKGLSVWDVFCRTDGKIFENQNAETACDSYHRIEEDVELVKGLGVKAYRFSVSWPRVLPEGVGKINKDGLDYYVKLVKLLKKNGIEPYVTLYHWDLPFALSLKGGFLNRDFSEWFAEYVEVVAEAFGDDVKTYFTFNEPASIIGAGYCNGAFAPGVAMGDWAFPALHNMLLAHGKAAGMLKEKGKTVGIVCCGDAPYPISETKENIEAARAMFFSGDCLWHTMNVFDPIFLGDYPQIFYEKYGDVAARFIKDGDMRAICGNTDLCCMNHYNGYPVETKNGAAVKSKRVPGYPMTATGWAFDENGLYWMFKFLGERYRKPMMLTENGMSCYDRIFSDGKVHDPSRIEYMRRYIPQVKRCVEEGIDLRGYFAWSLLDNFEWLCGFSQRFGLVYVDQETKNRTPKDSYYYYADLIKKEEKL